MNKLLVFLAAITFTFCISCKKTSVQKAINLPEFYRPALDTGGTTLVVYASIVRDLTSGQPLSLQWTTYYFENNRITKTIDSVSHDGEKSQLYELAYSYNTQGRVTKIGDFYLLYYDVAGNVNKIDQSPLYRHTYSYNTAGVRLTDTLIRTDSSRIVQRYFYDAKGNISRLETVSYYPSGAQWGPTSIDLYAYDDKKNPLTTIPLPNPLLGVVTPNNIISITTIDSAGNIHQTKQFAYTYNKHGLPTQDDGQHLFGYK